MNGRKHGWPHPTSPTVLSDTTLPSFPHPPTIHSSLPHTTIPPLQPPPHHHPSTPSLRPFQSHSLTGPPSPPHPPCKHPQQMQALPICMFCRCVDPTPLHSTSPPNPTSLHVIPLHYTIRSNRSVSLYFIPLQSNPYHPTPLQSGAASPVKLNPTHHRRQASGHAGRQRQASKHAGKQTDRPPMRLEHRKPQI